VEAANLALEPDVEGALHAAGVLVVPDLIAGVGGSLAIEALYAADPRDGQAILDHVTRRAGEIARDCLARSRTSGRSPRAEALARAG
jgi:glutamate dehydrogenase/leucine dehydrogenase